MQAKLTIVQLHSVYCDCRENDIMNFPLRAVIRNRFDLRKGAGEEGRHLRWCLASAKVFSVSCWVAWAHCPIWHAAARCWHAAAARSHDQKWKQNKPNNNNNNLINNNPMQLSYWYSVRLCEEWYMSSSSSQEAPWSVSIGDKSSWATGRSKNIVYFWLWRKNHGTPRRWSDKRK